MEADRALSHAYIIVARPEQGEAEARTLAQRLLCTGDGPRPCGHCENCRKAACGIHPDILTVSRRTDEKGRPKPEIYVDQIREIIADAAVLPNEAETKVYIIRDAGSMNAAAQNALLKLLEEPPRFVAFLLITESAGLLLDTVRSRCALLYRGGEEDAPSAEYGELARRYLEFAAAKARISLLSLANEMGERKTDEMQEFVRAVRLRLTDMLCGRLPAMGLPRAELLRLERLMETAAEYLRFHVGTRHVLGLLTVDTIMEN